MPVFLFLLLSVGLPLHANAEIRLVDDNGDELVLAQPAQRIISLAPNITEVLFHIGAGEKIVGADEYSNYPEAAKKIQRVNNHAAANYELILSLKPDLVIADFNLGQGLTGLDVIGEARRLWDEDLPALVVTGETDAAVKQSIQSAGLMCLPKPVKPAALKSAILSSGSRPGTETDN